MKHIQIINGPNLNILGEREPSVYGNKSFNNFFDELKKQFPDVKLEYFQSNSEGEIIDKLQEIGFSFDGIILNAGAYTHTSIAISDAIRSIKSPVIEYTFPMYSARKLPPSFLLSEVVKVVFRFRAEFVPIGCGSHMLL
jgi:3-dehydroquinate dehydratase-2